MATFIRSGMARRTANPTSILKTQADAYIAAHANPDTGTVTDPSVYGKALQMLSGDNTPAGLKAQADYQNAQSKLTAKLNNAYATKGMIDYNFKNAQYQVGKRYALNPGQLIQSMYALYDFHGSQIENHIKQMQQDGLPTSALETYGGTIADEAAQYEKLLSSINTKDTFKTPAAQQEAQNFGMAVGTDSTGKITSFALHVVPSGSQDATFNLKGANDSTGTSYIRTNATYGGIPLYVIPQSDKSDPSGKTYTARIGDLSFTGIKGGAGQQAALELTDQRSWARKTFIDKPIDAVERVVGAGGKPAFKGVPEKGIADRAAAQGATMAANNAVDLLGHIKPEDFSNMTSLPAGSIAADSAGNFYYVNDNGSMFAAPNADIMSKNIGIPAGQIKSAAQPITSQDLERLQSQQDPDARANMWMADPTENSPLNQTSPTSVLTSPNQPDTALATPAAPAAAAAPSGPPLPDTKGRERAIQAPQGQELAQATTQDINSGKPNLPNAGQAPAVA